MQATICNDVPAPRVGGTVNNAAGPFKRAANLETSNFYMGSIMSFLVNGSDSDGRVAVMEYQAKPGNEPPPHIHEWEHEIYYIIEGTLEAYCDGKVIVGRPGDTMFMPAGKAHAWYIRSQNFRMLISVISTRATSVGLDSYFMEMSAPAESMSLPKEAVTYAMADPAHAVQVGKEHGIIILSPDETAELLPHYPGFGVPRELVKE